MAMMYDWRRKLHLLSVEENHAEVLGAEIDGVLAHETCVHDAEEEVKNGVAPQTNAYSMLMATQMSVRMRAGVGGRTRQL
jgi:hypothetical protein